MLNIKVSLYKVSSEPVQIIQYCYQIIVSELVFMPHQHLGHMKMGPKLKVSFERQEKQGIRSGTPGLVVLHITWL